jgi:hypothetical protein
MRLRGTRHSQQAQPRKARPRLASWLGPPSKDPRIIPDVANDLAAVTFGRYAAATDINRRGLISSYAHRWNLAFGRCIISALSVEAAMPLTGPIPEGQAFFCPRCGAHYAVTHSPRGKSVEIGDQHNAAKCVVCGQTMATSDATGVPTFKLVHRPEDA